jgi:uncharacterized protein with HEPN domain
MRKDRERLLDILEAIERMEKYASVDKPDFDSSELIQTWMVHNIQVIGEAASSISEEFRNEHAEVPWRSIAGMRNTIVHAYFRVDLDEVWSVVRNDLPTLKSWIQDAIQSTGDDFEPVD